MADAARCWMMRSTRKSMANHNSHRSEGRQASLSAVAPSPPSCRYTSHVFIFSRIPTCLNIQPPCILKRGYPHLLGVSCHVPAHNTVHVAVCPRIGHPINVIGTPVLSTAGHKLLNTRYLAYLPIWRQLSLLVHCRRYMIPNCFFLFHPIYFATVAWSLATTTSCIHRG
jgi:hypothetical protein